MLVAGSELDWLDTGDMEGAGANLVSLPGGGGECIGMFGDIVGTVNKCRVSIRIFLKDDRDREPFLEGCKILFHTERMVRQTSTASNNVNLPTFSVHVWSVQGWE